MADKWHAGVNGDWNDTNNWSSTKGGATGVAKPANTNDVYLWVGAVSLDTNLDQSAVTAATLNILEGFGLPSGATSPVAGITIGSAAAPLKISATTVTIKNTRLSAIYLQGTYTTIDIKALAPGGKVYIVGGTVTNVYAGQTGQVEFADSAELTGTLETSGAVVKLGTQASSPDLAVYASVGSFVESKRLIKSGNIEGTVVLLDAASVPSSSNITVGRGGTFKLNCNNAIGGSSSDTLRVLAGGTLTARENRSTITINSKVIYHSGATVDLPVGVVTAASTQPVGPTAISPP